MQAITTPPSEPALDRETLSARVRAARHDKRMTLVQVAQAAGISAATVSRVERGQMSLTYEKLTALARALGIELSSLLAGSGATGSSSSAGPSLTRAGQGVSYRSDAYLYTWLNADLARKRMTPTRMVVYARTVQESPGYSRHAGEEFLFVLSGALQVHFETGEAIDVAQGDCLYFDSRVGHFFLSSGEGNAEIIGAISETG
ncbi:transcriptional regulator with XRE-family HTH domain [Acidovorax soli]|jgi:transcriptional regulator with XRE-family HTH domain|uniref:Transcriptional regulator with XRE-family HTH domain n=1 Tax=Acidovorax soli TaxID=592050 RepID=A0A7X0PAW2_9BURK|nr:XRE family transcriptional regulator [Acidovorax soli]MBB6558530.1 transcriptional regulator with XRE-family HTH domain [Acidovorax soli]